MRWKAAPDDDRIKLTVRMSCGAVYTLSSPNPQAIEDVQHQLVTRDGFITIGPEFTKKTETVRINCAHITSLTLNT